MKLILTLKDRVALLNCLPKQGTAALLDMADQVIDQIESACEIEVAAPIMQKVADILEEASIKEQLPKQCRPLLATLRKGLNHGDIPDSGR